MKAKRHLIVGLLSVAAMAVVLGVSSAHADTTSIADLTPPTATASATPTPAVIVVTSTDTPTPTATADVSALPETGSSPIGLALVVGVFLVSTIAYFSLPSKRS